MRRGILMLFLLFLPGIALAQDTSGVVTEAQVFDIARKLRCPICVSESVAASSAQISVTMREEIREHLRAGLSEQEIMNEFTAAYGDWVLLEPPRQGIHLLVWLLPVVVAVVGAIMLVGFMRRSTRAGAEKVDVDEEDLERLRQEMSRNENGETK